RAAGLADSGCAATLSSGRATPEAEEAAAEQNAERRVVPAPAFEIADLVVASLVHGDRNQHAGVGGIAHEIERGGIAEAVVAIGEQPSRAAAADVDPLDLTGLDHRLAHRWRLQRDHDDLLPDGQWQVTDIGHVERFSAGEGPGKR